MRLDATDLRYVSATEFKVLQAVEVGSRNHEVVPTALLAQISGIRSGIIIKALDELAKRNLVARERKIKYEGFRLTYGGLDWLSLRAFTKRKLPSVVAVGNKIGVGKESDIYVVKGPEGDERVLKLHRLGRISFRAIKEKRDYLGKRTSASWMYMSRLAAEKEFAFMKILYDHGYPVPTPIDQSRHCIVMSLVDSYPLRQIDDIPSPADLYAELMDLIVRFAQNGLIHGDFNEFNILIKRKTGEAVVIDFPQMVSTRHANAEYFFNRDVNCIRKFFRKRFRFEGTSWPTWKDVLEAEGDRGETAQTVVEGEEEQGEAVVSPDRVRLDELVEASGWGREMQRELEDYMLDVQDLPVSDEESEEGEGEGEDDDDAQNDAEEPRGDDAEDLEQPETELDEAAFQASMSARLEALRLHKALGNDDPDDGEGLDHSSNAHRDESDSDDFSDTESDTDSDASSGQLSGVAPTDYTAYTRAERKPVARVNPKKVDKGNQGEKETLRAKVRAELGASGRGSGAAGPPRGKTKEGMGKQKGHKWKTSAKHMVGKETGW